MIGFPDDPIFDLVGLILGKYGSFSIFFSLGAIVLRVPVLYGNVEKLAESAVTVLFEKLLPPLNEKIFMSDYEKRYPTHVCDVASIIFLLADKTVKEKVPTSTHKCLMIFNYCFVNIEFCITEQFFARRLPLFSQRLHDKIRNGFGDGKIIWIINEPRNCR